MYVIPCQFLCCFYHFTFSIHWLGISADLPPRKPLNGVTIEGLWGTKDKRPLPFPFLFLAFPAIWGSILHHHLHQWCWFATCSCNEWMWLSLPTPSFTDLCVHEDDLQNKLSKVKFLLTFHLQVADDDRQYQIQKIFCQMRSALLKIQWSCRWLLGWWRLC